MLQGGCGQPLQCPRQEGWAGPWTGVPLCGLSLWGAEGDRGWAVSGKEESRGDLSRALAPTEVGGIAELTEACDWWSFGSLLYELLTGMVSSWAGCGALVGVTEGWMAWA